jgi:osmoprotectant transport system permease protein
MGPFQAAVEWFQDPANWSGDFGIPHRLWEHIWISALTIALGALIALPIGLLIGHTRKAEFFTISVANIGRALPSFGVLALIFPLTFNLPGELGFWPIVIALTLLAIPPILTNTNVAIREVDASVVEAARGMGMTGGQILRRIEIPLGAPIIVAGLRTAAVQVVATATLWALVAGGGLGRYIVDGLVTLRTAPGQLVGGAILVALLALATELLFNIVQRLTMPGGRSRAAVSKRARELQVGQTTA